MTTNFINGNLNTYNSFFDFKSISIQNIKLQTTNEYSTSSALYIKTLLSTKFDINTISFKNILFQTPS